MRNPRLMICIGVEEYEFLKALAKKQKRTISAVARKFVEKGIEMYIDSPLNKKSRLADYLEEKGE